MRVWGTMIKASFYLSAVAFICTLPAAAQVVGPDGKTIGNLPIAGPNSPPTQLNIAPPAPAPQPAPQKSKTNKDIEKILGVGKAFIELNRQINNQNKQPVRVNSPQPQTAPSNRNRGVVFYNASFNCRGKLNRTEYVICTNPQLARRDLVMADLYRLARKDGVPGVRQAQRKWRINRNNRCGTNANCLLNVYQERINQLKVRPARQVVRKAAPVPVRASAPAPTNRYSRLVAYKCTNGADFMVRYEGDNSFDVATLIMEGAPEVVLDGQPSGSGSLYSDGQIDWQTKSRTGVLSQLGRSLTCGEK